MSNICERCGRPHDGSFGSGRFCCRSCANSRPMTETRRENIRKGLLRTTICKCRFCDKTFVTIFQKSWHENHCELNESRTMVNKRGSETLHNRKLQRPVKVKNYKTGKMEELDITYGELEKYREIHKCCEICGKSVENLSLPTSKVKHSNLSIDHDHTERKFRGLLCLTCNRELGWYENNKDAIGRYLSKLKK